jgi:hypothetical protein
VNRDEVLQRLCALNEKVSEYFGHRHPSDCFCGKGGLCRFNPSYDGTHENGYRCDGFVIEFLEKCVNDKLRKLKNKKASDERRKRAQKKGEV